MPDKKELLQKAYALKSEISRLKQHLSHLNSKKRSLYDKRDAARATFRPVIEKIKELKSKRDEHTASVKELKGKRQSATNVAKKTFTELKKLRDEKEKKSKALGVRRFASDISRDIKKMEFKAETSAIPFEQEKKFTKIIKEKKAELEKAKQLSGIVQGLRSYSKKLHASKTESDRSHQELRLHASVSQKLHEDMLSHAKKADEIKANLKPIEKELSDIKKYHAELKALLQQKLYELPAVDNALAKIRAEEEMQRKAEREKVIAAKEKELTDKMKAGKKLTRDDLIMLQDD